MWHEKLVVTSLHFILVFSLKCMQTMTGSAMSLSQNILPALEQLGLLEELQNMSLPVKSLDMYKENMTLIGSIDGKPYDDL